MTNLNGDIVRVVRDLTWDHATLDALYDAAPTHDSPGIRETSQRDIRDARRATRAVNPPESPNDPSS